VIVGLVVLSHSAFAEEDEMDAPPIPPVTAEEPEATEAELKPDLAKAEAACLKEREAFVKKYTAVGEKPKETCECVVRSVRAKKSMDLAKAAVDVFTKKPEPKKAWTISEEFVHQAVDYCRADPKFETGHGEPENFDARMKEIESLMKVRKKRDR
jgi:hypothetical protein